MPTLPTLESSQSVFSTGALRSQQIDASPAAFGSQVGAALQQVGQAGQQAGGDANQIAQSWQAINNETAVNDTYANKFSPALRDSYQQYYALQGKDAVDQLPAFQQKLQDLQEQQRQTLANPAQQRMFDEVARRRTQQELDGMTRYADVQNKVYQQQASDGMVKSFQQQSSDKWNDPIVFNGMVNSITAERMAHGGMIGQPVEYTKAQIQQDVSKMTIDRLSMMANQDPVKAYSMLENGEDWGNGQHTNIQSLISAEALPSVQAHLMASAKQVFARDIAHATIYGGAVVDPASLQQAVQGAPPLTGVVLSNESGGQDFDKSGKLLTSAKGAEGSMQVMPTTQTDPGFGVTPAKDNSPAEIARVGRDYLGAMTARYQDPALTLAAYNAGPGQVDKWIAQYGDPRTGQISDQDFLNRIPFSETRKYVASGLAMIQQPGAKPTAMPTTNELATVLPSKVDQARAVAARMFPNDPSFADTVAARTSNYGETIIAGTRAQQSAAVDTLTRLMIGTKPDGSDRITSMDQLMANPAAKSAWAQATPEAQLAITNRLAKPTDVPLTQDGLKSYYQLRGQAANDPNSFIKQDLSSLYGQMPEKQILDLINIQSSLSKGDVNQANRTLNWQQTKSSVDDMLKPMGLGASAKAGSDESKTTEQFYGRLQDALEQYHDQNQKYPDAPTTRKIAGSLLVQGTQGQAGWLPGWLGGASTIPAFQSPDLNKFQVPVPADQKPQLAATFQKVMGHVPSDEELTQWYTKYSLSQKGK